MTKINILGTKVDSFSKNEFLLNLEKDIKKNKKIFLVTANPEGILLAKKDKKFRKAVNSANYITADGWGIVWASYFLNKKTFKNFLRFLSIPFSAIFTLIVFAFNKKMFSNIIPERISGSDIFWDILKIANKNDKKIYLLGGFSKVAEKTAKKIKNKFPNLRIVGVSESNPQDKEIILDINKTEPDFLFIAWGQPKQEIWIFENLNKINVNLAVGLGGTFDFIAGAKKRAPKILRDSGFEWLWRLFIEPKRIFRIFAAVPKFVYSVCREKIKRGNLL